MKSGLNCDAKDVLCVSIRWTKSFAAANPRLHVENSAITGKFAKFHRFGGVVRYRLVTLEHDLASYHLSVAGNDWAFKEVASQRQEICNT